MNRSGGVLRAVVADDEPQALKALQLALNGLAGVAVVEACSGGAQAVDAVQRERPDVVFLDIAMPEVDGFEVVRRMPEAEAPALVFVTAHQHEAVRAFDVEAVDYVLKPFDDARLELALDRVRRRRGAGTPDTADRPPATRLLVRDGARAYFVSVDDIDWIEADGKHVLLHTSERSHRLRATLTSVVERLDPRRFERVHRSHVLNVERVVELHPWFGGDYVAVLRGGAEVRVSRTYRDRLLRTFS